MKGLYRNILCWASLALLASACYEDKGNYDYSDINDVKIDIPQSVVRLPLQGETEIVVEPKLTQTMVANEDNLRFKWYIGSTTSEIICNKKECKEDHYHFHSEEKIFRMTVNADYNEKLQLLLEVEDVAVGTKFYQQHVVKIVKPFSNTWFVLQEEGGQSLLGVADGELDAALITPDVYQSQFNTTFPMQGKPISIDCRHDYGPARGYGMVAGMLPVKTTPMLMVCTDKNASLIYPTTCKTRLSIADMLYGAVKEGNTTWNPSYYHHSDYGEVICDQGRIWHSLMDGFAVYYTLKDKNDENIFADKAVELDGNGYLIYDNKNRRFLSYSYSSMDGFSTSFYFTQYVRSSNGGTWRNQGKKTAYELNSANEWFNPSKIDASWNIHSMISSNDFAIAMASDGGSTLKVLEFVANYEENVAGLYEIKLPAGVKTEDCKFTTSHTYNRIFFFATGNKVYKVDLNRGTPKVSVIYEHNDTNAKAAAIKFKETNKIENNPNRYDMQLGVGFNLNDGTSSVVEMKLTAAGDAKREEGSIYEYKGFKKIVDIAYNYAE